MIGSSRQEFTRDFIERRAPYFHEAFKISSRFHQATSTYEMEEVHDLRETLQRWSTTAPGDIPANLDNCPWQDVLAELEKAKAVSDEKGRHFGRKIWRKTGAASNFILPGLDAIPEELNILKGGLAAIFTLARQRRGDRMKLLGAFESIPNIILTAQNQTRRFSPEDKSWEIMQLHDSLWELYKTLIMTIPVLIERLNPNTFRNILLSPFRGFDNDQLLGTIQVKAGSVQRCIGNLKVKLLVTTHSTAASIHKTTKSTSQDVEALCSQVQELLSHQRNLKATLDAVAGKTALYHLLVEQTRAPSIRSVTLVDSPVDADAVMDLNEDDLPNCSLPAPPLLPTTLLHLLGVHHLAAVDDQLQVIRLGASLDISRAGCMVRSPHVISWLRSPGSAVVLVEECGDRHNAVACRVPPLSFVCATFAEALRENRNGMTLLFFCGRHVEEEDDPLAGPQGLARSLLAQLVLALVQRGWLDGTAGINLRGEERSFLGLGDVCELLAQLVSENVAEGAIVFCIIDGINAFERRTEWGKDFEMVMDCFRGLVGAEDGRAVFKLLMTSPTICQGFGELQPHQRVTLRGEGGPFSGRDVTCMVRIRE